MALQNWHRYIAVFFVGFPSSGFLWAQSIRLNSLKKELPIPLWHIKDLSNDSRTVLLLRKGVLNHKKFFAQMAQIGLQYYFIEHESPADPFADVAPSIVYLKKISPHSARLTSKFRSLT